jgi:hypothetical protein
VNPFDEPEVPGDPAMRPPPGFWAEFEKITGGVMGSPDDFVQNCLGAMKNAEERPRLEQAARVLRGVIEEYGEELKPLLLALLAEDVARIAAEVALKVVAGYGKADRRRA